jgi:hypothetical protein
VSKKKVVSPLVLFYTPTLDKQIGSSEATVQQTFSFVTFATVDVEIGLVYGFSQGILQDLNGSSRYSGAVPDFVLTAGF